MKVYENIYFGNCIKNILKDIGMSQKEFATAVGATEVTVSRWINGTRSPKLNDVIRIANVLNLTIDEIFEYNEIPIPPFKEFEARLKRNNGIGIFRCTACNQEFKYTMDDVSTVYHSEAAKKRLKKFDYGHVYCPNCDARNIVFKL